MEITHTNPLLQKILNVTGTDVDTSHCHCLFTSKPDNVSIIVYTYVDHMEYKLVGMTSVNGHAVFVGITHNDLTRLTTKYFSTTTNQMQHLDVWDPQYQNLLDECLDINLITKAFFHQVDLLTND